MFPWPNGARFIVLATAVAPTVALAQVGDAAYVHDPAIINRGDTYYIFGTGRGITVRTSRDLIHWTRAKPVFSSGHD